ncbi:MAG TPA: hypothetical protein PKN70_06880, partial [Smithellaceae bacterium]|nr:hypothetical protein [Smithellaceae bacterium]
HWLRPGGKLLFTYATKEYTGADIFNGFKKFMGENLFYSHTTPENLSGKSVRKPARQRLYHRIVPLS